MSKSESKTAGPSELVAVDLGSNSFHMIIAQLQGGHVHIIDRMRERVKLAAGLDDDKRITQESQARAIACLERFGQRLRTLPNARVRAVGTNTLRRARNARDFNERAQAALGHPIEVISGREEARLVYLGVAHDLSDDAGRRLVVDIGGGSTELILGERFEARRTESLHMGCVSYTGRFFADGLLSRENFRRATTEARVELEPIKRDFRNQGWASAVGSSGTLNAIAELLRANNWSDGITYDGLRLLRSQMIEQGSIANLSINKLSEERASVLPGGLAIVMGIFKSLRIDDMAASGGALREGLLYDTIGRIQHEDVRESTIASLSDRLGIDREQAARVRATAQTFIEQVTYAWELHHPDLHNLLGWAASVHEVGLAVCFSGYHTHGAYLLTHADLPGFSRDRQAYIAALVGAHRRRLKPDRLEALRAAGGETAVRLAVLLRLAATLNRGRDPSPLPDCQLTAAGRVLELRLPEGWLDKHPMTRTDLDKQRDYLAAAGLHFAIT
ncbi:MAG: exopolyphosphatase [Myxococcota bacterium]